MKWDHLCLCNEINIFIYIDYIMKNLQEHISENVTEQRSHRIYNMRDKFKLFDKVRSQINDDDLFIELMCRSLIQQQCFDEVIYDIADKQNLKISNI